MFNIRDDPCEYEDQSLNHPLIYNTMMERLEHYKKRMVPPKRSVHRDPEANPKRHGGVWEPWVKKGDGVKGMVGSNTNTKTSLYDFITKFVPSIFTSW